MGAGDFQPLINLQIIQEVFTKQAVLLSSKISIHSGCRKPIHEPE